MDDKRPDTLPFLALRTELGQIKVGSSVIILILKLMSF